MKRTLLLFYITSLIIGLTACDDKDKIDDPIVCPSSTTLLTSIYMPQEHEKPFGVRFVYDADSRLSYAYEYQLPNAASVNDTIYGWKYVFEKKNDNVVNVKQYYKKDNAEDKWFESSYSKRLCYSNGKITKIEEYSNEVLNIKETVELEWKDEKVVKRTINGVVYGDDSISYQNGNFVDFGTKTGSTSVNNFYYQKRTIDTKSTFGTGRSYLGLIPIEYMMAKDRIYRDYTFPLHLYFSDNALAKQIYSVFYEDFRGDGAVCISTKMLSRTYDFIIEYNDTAALGYPSKVVRNNTEKEVVVDFENEKNNQEQERTSEYTIEFKYEVRD